MIDASTLDMTQLPHFPIFIIFVYCPYLKARLGWSSSLRDGNLAQPDINSITWGHQGRAIVINFLPHTLLGPLFNPIPVASFLYKPARTETNVSHLFPQPGHLHENRGQQWGQGWPPLAPQAPARCPGSAQSRQAHSVGKSPSFWDLITLEVCQVIFLSGWWCAADAHSRVKPLEPHL